MAAEDPRIDAYIERAAPFAQPILRTLRKALHGAVPGLEETIKWGMPFFVREGRPFANMAAFKAHCAFGFWQGREAADAGREREAMGQFGRLASVKDLPPAAELKASIRAAAAAAELRAGRPAKPRTAARPALAMPDDFAAALARVPAAQRHYEAFAPSKQRDYLEWVLEARRSDTRAARIAQAVQWLAEGKARHWKYASKG